MILKHFILIVLCSSISFSVFSSTIIVGKSFEIKSIKAAIALSKNGDTIIVGKGTYLEGNIIVDKEITLIGKDVPVLDGQKKYEVLSIKADNVKISGFKIQHSGYASLDDPGGIKIYDSRNVVIINNHLYDNFFGIYLQYSKKCIIKNNLIEAFGIEEQQIGNGIHCWKSDSLEITGNTVSGHRDGIYFEFVTHSVIWKNIAYENIRYGLHFMFSNNDAYITNTFRNNGAGVAVMFTKKVIMIGNIFEENWGDSAYGLLLKEISDSHIINNKFTRNTSAIYMEGTNRIVVEKNEFIANGWGMKIQASCMDNTITANNFIGNTFDITTNGSLVLNTFNGNYWDKYEGYDLNKDQIGDVPYHPISLFSIIVENNPPAMLLSRSFMITLLDKSEKMIPSLTPDEFHDTTPLMRSLKL
jgi:nitrous oxidase accessory protein